MALRPFEVRLYTSVPVTNTTPYRVLLVRQTGPAQWRITRTDGYADAALTINDRMQNIPGLSEGRCMEFWGRDKFGVMIRLYRGYITYLADERRQLGKKAGKSIIQTAVTLHGVWTKRKGKVVRQRFAKPEGQDVGTLFSNIASRWIKPVYPELEIDGTQTGQTINSLDGWRRSFGDIATDLVDATGGFAVCGGDVDPSSGKDRLYLRPFDPQANAITINLPDPARSVLRYEVERDATRISNVIDLSGGSDRFPNLLAEAVQGNTSFEYPTFETGEGVGNLLSDGGFENATGYSPGTPVVTTVVTGLRVRASTRGQSHVTCDTPGAFHPTDTGRILTITGGAGWAPGVYNITGSYTISIGGSPSTVLIVNGSVATIGAVGGVGELSSLAAWELTGNASVVATGGAYGDADGSQYMVFLADDTASITKPFGPNEEKIVEGKNYRLRVRLRLQTGDGVGNRVKLAVKWYDEDDLQVGSDIEKTYDDSSGLYTTSPWNTFTLDTGDCPTGAVRGYCYVLFDDQPVGITSGILVDNMTFTNATDVVQPGWELKTYGSAQVLEADWAFEGTSDDYAVHGAYSLRVKVTASGSGSNDVVLRPQDNVGIGVVPGQRIYFRASVKNPIEQAAKTAPDNIRPEIRLRLDEYSENNEYLRQTVYTVDPTDDATWLTPFVAATVGGDCRIVHPVFSIVGDGEMLIDALEVRDAGAMNAGFIEGNTFEETLSVGSAFPPGSDEYESLDTWGQITELVDDKNISTTADMNAFGVLRLGRTSLPIEKPPIETILYAYPFFPGKYLRGVGADAERILPQPLPIFEVEGEWDGKGLIKMRPLVGSERKSETRVTRDIVRRELLKEGRGGSNGPSYSSSPGTITFGGEAGGVVPDAGSTVKGIAKLSTAPASPTEPIAVGANDTDYIAAIANTAEVIAGRVRAAISPFAGNTYASLFAHFSGVWTAIANLYNRTITAGTGLAGGGDLTTNRTISLANTTVTPGSYTATDITVDAQGRITAAANGSGGGYSPSGSSNQTLRFSATNTLTASSLISNTGTRVGINNNNPSYSLFELDDNGASTNGTILAINGATAMGASSGAGVGVGLNNTPNAADIRLGYSYYHGRLSMGGAFANAVQLEAFSSESWVGGGQAGSYFTLKVTPNGSTTPAEMMRVDGAHVGIKTTAANSVLSVGGSVSHATRTVAAGSRTLDITDHFLFASSGVTITLPTAVGIAGRVYVIKQVGSGTVTISTTSSQTIDGSVGTTITATNGVLRVISDNANWQVW